MPQVPSQHASTIIGGNWPQTSETGTVSAVIELFEHSAESVGTADTAETMHALIEACAKGHTPTELVADFTAQQRKAFDRAVEQLNKAQGASVMAQDILNTKVQLNGIVTSFDAAVDQLIAAAAAAPQTPKTQAEFQKRYQELLDAAQQQANRLGSSHRSTQDALIAGIQQGSSPEIPAGMTPYAEDMPTVAGMPDNALGSVLQQVAGQMMKPQNLPMPNLNQLGQSVAPLAQSAQAAIGQLMSSLGGAGGEAGIPISEDALSVLANASNIGDQDATLSGPEGVGAGAGAGLGAGGLGGSGGRTTLSSEGGREGLTPVDEESGKRSLGSLSAPSAANATVAAAPAPAETAAPAASVPTTTLSASESAPAVSPLSSATTHTSSGDGAVGTAALSPTAAAAAGAPHAAAGPMAPMMPMMPLGAGAAASSGGGSSKQREASESAPPTVFVPDRPAPSAELTDFGSDLKGLEHATDKQLVAASILAALVRAHDRLGITTEIAVGVSPTAAVFATSDGLGFLPVGIHAIGHLTPLITLVPDDFTARWLGCDQPWRPLLEAAPVGLVEDFEVVVTTDATAETSGVLVLTPEQIAGVNIAAGSAERWSFDAVDSDDVRPAMAYLESVWGRPAAPAAELEEAAWRCRWSGDASPGEYPRRWVDYLLAAAAVDLSIGDIGDARYALRSALRVPEAKEN